MSVEPCRYCSSMGLCSPDCPHPTDGEWRPPKEEPLRGVKPTKKRGFAVLKEKNPRLMSDLARRGGKAAHVMGTAHRFTREEAMAAGKKGAAATKAKRAAEEEAEKHEGGR